MNDRSSSATSRSAVRRHPERGTDDRTTVHAILDAGFVCHIGFAVDGQPYVIPTIYGRIGDTLYLHGSVISRLATTLAAGVPACVTVTLVDGVVLARSAFAHSVNYRSAVIFGTARAVQDDAECAAGLEALTNHVVPGRWQEVRTPSPEEMQATLVLAMPIEEASAKVRSGPPMDKTADRSRPVWAGVVPLHTTPGQPAPDAYVQPGVTPFEAERLRR